MFNADEARKRSAEVQKQEMKERINNQKQYLSTKKREGELASELDRVVPLITQEILLRIKSRTAQSSSRVFSLDMPSGYDGTNLYHFWEAFPEEMRVSNIYHVQTTLDAMNRVCEELRNLHFKAEYKREVRQGHGIDDPDHSFLEFTVEW